MVRKATSIERVEAQTLRRQQIAFSILTLFVLSILLLLHTLFARLLGDPSESVILLLGVGFSWKVLEILWLQARREGISENIARVETIISAVAIFVLAAMLAFLTNRDESPYFVLLAIPILQCAYHLGLASTIVAVLASVSTIFWWNVHYFALHPPPRPTEFLECGMISVIYALIGPLVWYLVNQLGEKQVRLYDKMVELQEAREKLAAEEKLSAIGRLASGIAHEIRNPVAMIASSLATAAVPSADGKERDEMFAIAEREAKRLETLTSEFLNYARPSKPQRAEICVSDILRHVAEVTRMRSQDASVEVICKEMKDVWAPIDAAQVEGALLNLALNALDATPEDGRIEIRGRIDGQTIGFDIQNSGPMISDEDLGRIFEPFFTTKAGGTGLGLAIARGVAKAHGGDLWVSSNLDGAVVFSMTVARESTESVLAEAAYGQSPNR